MCIIFLIFSYLFLNMKKRYEKNKNNKKQDIENSEIIEQKECKGLTINDTIIEIRDIDYLDKMNS